MYHISVDVEASGPVPGFFDMISVGMVLIEPTLTQTFYAEFAPLHDRYDEGAYKSIGITREEHEAMPPAEASTLAMIDWLDNLGTGRKVMVSDNPAFDFPFVSWHCHRFHGRNPLGHSARRIGDLSAGLKRNYLETQGWKRLRKTKHTHNALDDAKGNAEALMALIDQNGLKAPWNR